MVPQSCCSYVPIPLVDNVELVKNLVAECLVSGMKPIFHDMRVISDVLTSYLNAFRGSTLLPLVLTSHRHGGDSV